MGLFTLKKHFKECLNWFSKKMYWRRVCVYEQRNTNSTYFRVKNMSHLNFLHPLKIFIKQIPYNEDSNLVIRWLAVLIRNFQVSCSFFFFFAQTRNVNLFQEGLVWVNRDLNEQCHEPVPDLPPHLFLRTSPQTSSIDSEEFRNHPSLRTFQ